jgi:hypothetical protein
MSAYIPSCVAFTDDPRMERLWSPAVATASKRSRREGLEMYSTIIP